MTERNENIHEVSASEILEIIDGQSDDVKQEVVSRVSMFSGPIPPPHLLKEYDGVVENGAERIMQMAESEVNHRHTEERRNNKASIILAVAGVYLSYIFVIGLGAVTVYFLSVGKQIEGLLTLVGTMAPVVISLLKNSSKQ